MAPKIVGMDKKLGWSDITRIKRTPPPPAGGGKWSAAAISVFVDPRETAFNLVPIPGSLTNLQRRLALKDFNVYIRIDPKKSWKSHMIPNLPEIDQRELLNHEQGHYDIAALCYLEAFKKMLALENTMFGSDDEVLSRIGSLWDDAQSKIDDIQPRYDEETDRGRTKPKQLIWDGKISAVKKDQTCNTSKEFGDFRFTGVRTIPPSQ